MLNMFKKSFWIPYEDSTVYPTMAKAMEEISRYCEERGETCVFTGDDEVEIEGKDTKFTEDMKTEAEVIMESSAGRNRGKHDESAAETGLLRLLISPPPPLQNND